MSERRAELLLALTTVFWSGTFVFTKVALQECDPIFFVTVRFFLATLATAALWWRYCIRIDSRTFRDGMILGALYGAGFVVQTFGLQYTTISKSAFITGMVVVFIPGADWLVRRQRPRLMHLAAVALAGIGLLLLTHPEWDHLNEGDVLTIFGALFWSFYIAFLDKSSSRPTDIPKRTEQLVFVQFLTTLALGLFVHLLTSLIHTSGLRPQNDAPMRMELSSAVVIALLYTALFGSLASTTIQTKVQRFVAPVKAGIIFTLEPIFATVIAYFTHDERLSMLEICGAALMLGAVIFADMIHKGDTEIETQELAKE